MKVEARGLCVSLKGRDVLRGLNATAYPGELTAVVGPNGAGKTTLLKTLGGLLSPLAGSAVLAERPISAWEPRALARCVAYLPQDRTVHWALSVRAVVALGRLPYQSLGAGETAADTTAIEAALSAMRVTHLTSRPILELSGGERARVLVARALAQEPRVLLADEPAAGLDPAHQITLFQHLATLANSGRTVMVALHDLSLAARFCHSVMLIDRGRVLASGQPARVLTPEHLATAYGVTSSYQLVQGLPVVLPLDVLP